MRRFLVLSLILTFVLVACGSSPVVTQAPLPTGTYTIAPTQAPTSTSTITPTSPPLTPPDSFVLSHDFDALNFMAESKQHCVRMSVKIPQGTSLDDLHNLTGACYDVGDPNPSMPLYLIAADMLSQTGLWKPGDSLDLTKVNAEERTVNLYIGASYAVDASSNIVVLGTPGPTVTPTPGPTIPLQGLQGVQYPSTDLLAGRKPDTLTYIVKRVKFTQSQDLSSIRIWGIDTATSQPILAAWYDGKASEWRWKEFGLGDLADVLGITFGIAVNNRLGQMNNPSDKALIAREANLIVPEDGLEWRYVRPSPEQFYWGRADLIIDFATQNGKRIRAHPVIESSPDRMPGWLLQKVEQDKQSLSANPNDSALRQKIRTEYLELLTTYIKTIMKRYKDRISEWSILNEMFDDSGKFRADNFWYQFIGDDYPEIAVRTAKEVDPNAILIINDFFLQDQNSPKLKAYLNLLKALKDKGLLQARDGLGFQGHGGILDPRTKETFKSIFRGPAQLGLSVYITELDTFNVYANDPQTLSKQANLYDRIVRACLELNNEFNRPVCQSITTWGYKDNDSWVLWADPKPSYPLLFSATLKKKPDYDAIFAAFLENGTK